MFSILYKNLKSTKFDTLIKFGIIAWYIIYFIGMFFILKSNGAVPYKTILSYPVKNYIITNN